MTKKISGIAASNGVAIAKAYKLVDPDLSFAKTSVTDVDAEKGRLNAAFDASKADLTKIKAKAVENLGAEEAEVFEAHLTILSDPELVGAIQQQIEKDQVNAETALSDVTDGYIAMFETMTDNAYMQERAADIRDITKRVLSHLLNVTLPNPALIDEEVVIIAKDLTPSDTAQLDRKFVKGFITDLGGRTSHSSIMARTLEIPAVVGTEIATTDIAEDELVIVDGLNGHAIIAPDEATITEYQKIGDQYLAQKAEWACLKDEPTTSADGVKFMTGANIGTPKDLPAVLENGAEGIGLYRTEFLYMDSNDMPSEEDQFEAYKTVLEGMQGKPVTVRTMDIGGDKKLPYMPLPEEENPFLGYRAIRISLDKTEMFKTQLRALVRASAFGTLWIMFPMVATLPEFRAAKAVFETVKAELKNEGVNFDDNIKLGIMIEIPSAAILADKFAKEVDFFSIGTNDLIQYTMAADRGNEKVAYLYQPYSPSILRLIKRTIDCAHKEGKFVAVCGEMGGDPIAVPLLVGLGLDEFSMSATSILQARSLIKNLSTTDMQALAEKALDLDTNDEVAELVKAATTNK
ncbi:phosphoenolpyruvate--protein phosphotransferase [Periweissella fabalis]|uniref:Phosphoenolpyruvate-protein phosphotransferase n=1 Tax=Periweissella fabalis TaxID=1070421 RepID=A0A7X6N568_9LACO|nr:phosphoenolpyruvate--protein phosphotransferase [Periweissella fabalis]MCM0598198.1 phosphoenolpyruvate--protein phosphotransferase [Periweissella fabalis]NKZ24867.1 phosphoenolpyruvate--protein phosphotransferase [Periweissella fabalis]